MLASAFLFAEAPQPDGGRTFILPSERLAGVSDGVAPRTDFRALADRLHATVGWADPSRALAPIESRLRFSLAQAGRTRRARPARIVSLSERVGIPLCLSGGSARHVMVAHLLTSAEKRLLQRATGFLQRADVTLVFSRAQERYLRDEVGLDAARATFVYDKVDHRFFVPGGEAASETFVLAVGRERRDYLTLIAALSETGIPGVIVAGSAWSHRNVGELDVPDHVRILQGLSYPELLALYQRATLVVVPIEPDIDYAAGVNGVLEGMACGVPVVASATPGLEGYIDHGHDGWTVPAGDLGELRDAIVRLWDDVGERERLGRAGRATVEAGRTIEMFTDRVIAAVES